MGTYYVPLSELDKYSTFMNYILQEINMYDILNV